MQLGNELCCRRSVPQAAEERAKGCIVPSVLLGTVGCQQSNSASSLPWQKISSNPSLQTGLYLS